MIVNVNRVFPIHLPAAVISLVTKPPCEVKSDYVLVGPGRRGQGQLRLNVSCLNRAHGVVALLRLLPPRNVEYSSRNCQLMVG